MIIGINALFIKWGVNAGTETYFTNIVKLWYDHDIHGVKFILFCNSKPRWWKGEKDHFSIRVVTIAKSLVIRLFYEQFIFPFKFRKCINILYNPGYVGIYFLNVPQVTTIHDGFAWVYPKEIGFIRSIYWKIFIPLTANKATKIIADSTNTLNDITNFCKLKENKIEVIYLGGSHFEVGSSKSNLLDTYSINSNEYFHCVGFFKNIKNPFRILDAFKSYKINNPSSNKKLVLAGHVGSNKAMEILNYSERFDDVIYVGRVDDLELVELYKNSLGLIFPSLYEGFGIPILEAQSYGCPVVTSRVSSMPEVAGDGAILVNPLNVVDIENAFQRLDQNNLEPLISKGYENCKRFCWSEASKRTLNVLCEVAE